jgi:putative PIN family toxin of toxin-antitoxin system
MIKVVIDTNVLVSALWKPIGNPFKIVELTLRDKIVPCYDHRIIHEYRAVLNRPKLAFSGIKVQCLLDEIKSRGFSVVVEKSLFPLPDESDRKFYDVATACEAYLVTGNVKHYPKEPFIFTPSEFLEKIQNVEESG